MESIDYIKCDPTSNLTILVKTAVPREKQLSLGKKLIGADCLCAEQAGYIELPERKEAAARLQMMAGEFCGNASMSLAACLAKKEGLAVGEKKMYTLEVSGTENLVHCAVEAAADGFFGTVDMPFPHGIEKRCFLLAHQVYTFPVVHLDGISHIIWETEKITVRQKQLAEQAAAQWEAEIDAPAFGILLWEKANGILAPYVRVKGGSQMWEASCGSGSCAVAAYAANCAKKSVTLSLKQEGGTLTASAQMTEGRLCALRLKGFVRILEEGSLRL